MLVMDVRRECDLAWTYPSVLHGCGLPIVGLGSSERARLLGLLEHATIVSLSLSIRLLEG